MKDFKVRCTNENGSDYFTKGEIYEVHDGLICDNTGELYSSTVCSTVEQMNENFVPRFELVEESKMFTKADLQANDLVIFRNEEFGRAVFLSNELHIVNDDLWVPVTAFNQSLICEHNRRYDVMKVARPKEAWQMKRDRFNDATLLFDRDAGIGCEKPAKEISVSEAAKLLTEKFGENVKIVVGK